MASSDDREHLDALFRAIHAVVRRIPRGRVATYGQVAEIAGIPNGGRIGAAALKQGVRLPWQRVIGKASKTRGRIAIHDPIGAALQRELLEREGVEVGDRGLIDLGRFGWNVRGTRQRSRSGTRSEDARARGAARTGAERPGGREHRKRSGNEAPGRRSKRR